MNTLHSRVNDLLTQDLPKFGADKSESEAAVPDSLQNRVNDLLTEDLPQYAADESESEIAVLDSLSTMLQEAEQELRAIEASVDRLRWEVAKVSD